MRFTLAILAAVVAVRASPLPIPQGVTAMLTPTASAPSGCMPSMNGTFGIAVQNVTGGAMSASQLPDGQPQATTGTVAQISDGQIQATPTPVSQLPDGQIQATTATPVKQITDGQIQGPKKTMAPVTQISDGQIQATYIPPVAQISDGQIQATTAAPAVSQLPDGQPQATTGAPAVSQLPDGQPQATPTPAVSEKSDGQPQATGVSQTSDGQPQATDSPMMSMVGCKSNSTLALTLEDGVLKDDKGRTGYIAANYQFQFDDPPQTGAIYTAGWSVCANGSLALGGSNMFYQCLSGDFYNLYNEDWAPQCNAVTIDVLELMDCS